MQMAFMYFGLKFCWPNIFIMMLIEKCVFEFMVFLLLHEKTLPVPVIYIRPSKFHLTHLQQWCKIFRTAVNFCSDRAVFCLK